MPHLYPLLYAISRIHSSSAAYPCHSLVTISTSVLLSHHFSSFISPHHVFVAISWLSFLRHNFSTSVSVSPFLRLRFFSLILVLISQSPFHCGRFLIRRFFASIPGWPCIDCQIFITITSSPLLCNTFSIAFSLLLYLWLLIFFSIVIPYSFVVLLSSTFLAIISHFHFYLYFSSLLLISTFFRTSCPQLYVRLPVIISGGHFWSLFLSSFFVSLFLAIYFVISGVPFRDHLSSPLLVAIFRRHLSTISSRFFSSPFFDSISRHPLLSPLFVAMYLRPLSFHFSCSPIVTVSDCHSSSPFPIVISCLTYRPVSPQQFSSPISIAISRCLMSSRFPISVSRQSFSSPLLNSNSCHHFSSPFLLVSSPRHL